MALNAAKRLADLRDQIAQNLREGVDPATALDEFEFLWGTTPDVERQNLSFNLKSIQELVARIRRRKSTAAGAGKLKSFPVVHREPGYGDEECYR